MKNLYECKEYYKDLYMDCLSSNSFGKSIFESVDMARYEMFCDTLKFIYGKEFEKVETLWSDEAIKEYYTKK
jgi:hypothetical protein